MRFGWACLLIMAADRHPSGFDRRAYMLDVSRDRVPTNETLEWLAGALAVLGFNELQLYVEHTFAYADHEDVWHEASALTPGDLRWLDRMCEANGIDLVANLNCFGHMERWLSHDQYRNLAECPDGAPNLFGTGKMRPGCLAPTAANATFAVALAREMAAAVRHRRIHIGGDEPFELGEGVSAQEVAERGRSTVYMEHLCRIIEPLVADGHEVMFWADQLRQDRDLIPKIPMGAVPVVWNYEAPSETGWEAMLPPELIERLGLPEDPHLGFESHARLLADADVSFWVAPGTGSWNSLIGRNRNAAATITDAVGVGAANQSPGLLLTDWGDNGHFQPLAVSLPSIARAGAAAMGHPTSDPVQVANRVEAALGCDPGIGALIDRLGHIGEDLDMTAINSSPIFIALCHTGMPGFGEPDPEALAAGLETLAVAQERFNEPIGGPRGQIVAAEMLAACQLAEIGLRRLGVQHGLDVETPTAYEVNEAANAQRNAWLLSSRPGGLDDSVNKLIR
ncbi:MAG: family 20 glycosylhydrolase [bacterium]|nr:family 20 glycosylhydrolase [bacterium]